MRRLCLSITAQQQQAEQQQQRKAFHLQSCSLELGAVLFYSSMASCCLLMRTRLCISACVTTHPTRGHITLPSGQQMQCAHSQSRAAAAGSAVHCHPKLLQAAQGNASVLTPSPSRFGVTE
eukprot:m.270685 g.270685  ORF g.270685 m.270685 type:complete len:121 (+) comp11083_c2_seq1:104-466(+)